jgi:hypothetical protein
MAEMEADQLRGAVERMHGGTATRAYAWSSPIEGSTKRRFFAVLHTERISSPLEAVRAAIVAEHQNVKSRA